MFTAITQAAVGVVLNDQQVVAVGYVDEALATCERERPSGRILEVRDDVEKPETLLAGKFANGFRNQPFIVGRHGLKTGLKALKRLDGGEIGRVFGENGIASIDENLAEQVEPLL